VLAAARSDLSGLYFGTWVPFPLVIKDFTLTTPPKSGTRHHTLQQRVEPTFSAASRKHRPGQTEPCRGPPCKPLEIERSNKLR
jgi:hypothetical protein